ncbi:hypothetical protein [Streptomyces sp. NPDC058613]|uniref:hypothetical protein n=1 Tax=Streptomyces sp. NPDC058613 TaxID=3346556 RepID=UPI003648AC68
MVGNPRREAAEARSRDEVRRALEERQAEQRRVAAEQATKKAAEREAQHPVCTGCGVRFTDDCWETGSTTDWARPTDSHPSLCDACKQWAVVDEGQTAGKQEHHEPVSRGAESYEFRRYPRCPVCAECGTQFTDERWKAAERVGWSSRQEANASLCEHCDQRHEAGMRQAWPDRHQQQARAAARAGTGRARAQDRPLVLTPYLTTKPAPPRQRGQT